VVARDRGKRNGKKMLHGNSVSFWSDEHFGTRQKGWLCNI